MCSFFGIVKRFFSYLYFYWESFRLQKKMLGKWRLLEKDKVLVSLLLTAGPAPTETQLSLAPSGPSSIMEGGCSILRMKMCSVVCGYGWSNRGAVFENGNVVCGTDCLEQKLQGKFWGKSQMYTHCLYNIEVYWHDITQMLYHVNHSNLFSCFEGVK